MEDRIWLIEFDVYGESWEITAVCRSEKEAQTLLKRELDLRRTPAGGDYSYAFRVRGVQLNTWEI